MTANPLTGQILAAVNSSREELNAYALADIATFTGCLRDTLPDVEPAVIGQVLLHVADLYGTFATCSHSKPITTEARVAVLLFGQVGQRLYLGDTRDEQTQG